jgi:N-acetyl-gamma-glutamyl-phosphate reductase
MYDYAMPIPSSPPTTVGVVGGSGYTGLELLRILGRHDGVRVAFASARSEAGAPTSIPGLSYEAVDEGRVADVDLLFLCLPHGEAVRWVDAARAAGTRVVDLTGDHRPGSGREHGVLYGVTERAASELPGAGVVANPGCYPTGVILSLAPLREAGLVDDTRPVVVQAASGVTGAGRSPRRELLFAEVHGDFRPYALGNQHRHLLEMRATLPGLQLLFTPHLLPLPRGIVETIAVPVVAGATAATARELWCSSYAASPVVRVLEAPPALAGVVGTDELHLGAFDNQGLEAPTLTVVAALDNLGKGAAGQAVQNMNLMLGHDAGRGLRCGRW